MIAPSGTNGRNPRKHKPIGRSQLWKLGLLWSGAVALLVALMLAAPPHERQYYLGVWVVLSLPLVIITVIWLTERTNK